MSYDARIAQARSVLEAHNSKVTNPAYQVNIEDFFDKLAAKGGTTEEGLSAATWETLGQCGCPEILARHIANDIFRKRSYANDNYGAATLGSTGPAYVGEKRAKHMTPSELLQNYDPKDPDSAVATRLAQLSRNQPFIVHNRDNSINQAASLKLLDELRDNFPPRDVYSLGDNRPPVRTYKIGDAPNKMADQNPLFPHEPLRPDGTCSHTQHSWMSVPIELRRLIFVARTETQEIVVNAIKDAIDVIEIAISDKAEEKLMRRYPRAGMWLEEMQSRGEPLPTLRIALGGVVRSKKDNDPFFGATKHKSF